MLGQHSANASVCRLAGGQQKWASQWAEGSLQVHYEHTASSSGCAHCL
jgi:hypothetical protein